jgi:hypothetical protein
MAIRYCELFLLSRGRQMMPVELGETQRRPALPNGTSPASSSTRSRFNVELV